MDNTLDSVKTIEANDELLCQLKPGQFIGEHGNYRLEKPLGVGGMGEVWLATEIRGGMEREVVCKTLRAERRELNEAQEKALKQFQLIWTLHHTNICPVYAIEKDPACGYVIVMGHANGGSYADWFAQLPKQNGGISLKTVCEVLCPIADALDFAHQSGVIHRDVNPNNMMFTKINGVQISWLIDFGIATQLRSESMATTGQFSSSGTDRYMAPEQKKGELQTAQTDEYSLAMVALEFLAGSLDPLAIVRLSPAVQTILKKALSEVPADRFKTCREFIDALSGCVTRSVSSRKSYWKWIRKAFVVILFVVFIYFVIVVIASWYDSTHRYDSSSTDSLSDSLTQLTTVKESTVGESPAEEASPAAEEAAFGPEEAAPAAEDWEPPAEPMYLNN